MDYNYTIIIPHHNIPELLVRCLKSIPRRDDVQIVVIDDTSNATSLATFCKISEEYKEIAEFYYTDAGLGGGAARNIGISKARGKFLLFVDCDDFLLPEIDNILERYKDSDADVIYFNAIAKDSETYETSDRANHLRRMIALYDSNRTEGETALRYQFGEPWCKIIRRELIEHYNIEFDVLPIHNDTTFSYMVGFYAKAILVDAHDGYCLTERIGSVSKALSLEKRRIRMDVFSRKNAFLRDNGVEYFDNMIFGPLVMSLKDFDLKEFFKSLKIAKSYRISPLKLLNQYLIYKRLRK